MELIPASWFSFRVTCFSLAASGSTVRFEMKAFTTFSQGVGVKAQFLEFGRQFFSFFKSRFPGCFFNFGFKKSFFFLAFVVGLFFAGGDQFAFQVYPPQHLITDLLLWVKVVSLSEIPWLSRPSPASTAAPVSQIPSNRCPGIFDGGNRDAKTLKYAPPWYQVSHLNRQKMWETGSRTKINQAGCGPGSSLIPSFQPLITTGKET